MKNSKVKNSILTALMLIVSVAGLLYAGHCDYVDAVVSEMKNNGAYTTLSEQYPDMSDGQLVDVYITNKK